MVPKPAGQADRDLARDVRMERQPPWAVQLLKKRPDDVDSDDVVPQPLEARRVSPEPQPTSWTQALTVEGRAFTRWHRCTHQG